MNPGATRREVLGQGLTAALAGAAGAALLDPGSVRAAGSPSGPASELGRLERMLSVKLLSVYVYAHVLASGMLSAGAEFVVTPLRSHEQAHARALGASLTLLGGAVPAEPANDAVANRSLARRKVPGRVGQLRGAHDGLRLLFSVERVTIGVSFVALMKLEDPALIGLAAQIMATDAQHESVLAELRFPGQGDMAAPYGLVQGVQ